MEERSVRGAPGQGRVPGNGPHPAWAGQPEEGIAVLKAKAEQHSLSNFVRFHCRGQSDVGRKRNHNEDSLLINEALGLFVVADGMGGHAGGELASRMAVETTESELLGGAWGGSSEEASPPMGPEPLERLRAAIDRACLTIFERSQQEPALAGMGTTLTALLLRGRQAFIAHVGDSRAYLIRDGEIEQITEDHSLVNEQLKAGILTEEQAKHSPYKNIITRSVGFEAHVVVDTEALPVQRGDTFLLCSDGLSNLVDDDEIALHCTKLPLEELPGALIWLANDRGGDDNITVVAVRME